VIKSFAHKGLETYFRTGSKKGIQPSHARKLDLILAALDAAHVAGDMNLPGFVFHPLQPTSSNVFAVRVSGNYRVTYRFLNGDAEVVDYLDYH